MLKWSKSLSTRKRKFFGPTLYLSLSHTLDCLTLNVQTFCMLCLSYMHDIIYRLSLLWNANFDIYKTLLPTDYIFVWALLHDVVPLVLTIYSSHTILSPYLLSVNIELQLKYLLHPHLSGFNIECNSITYYNNLLRLLWTWFDYIIGLKTHTNNNLNH